MALTQVGLERLNTATTKKIGTNKNLIINGAMEVAQRGTSSTSAGYQTVDRVQFAKGGTDETPTQAQVDVSSGTTPYTSGFRKAYKITNGNQTGGAGTSDNIIAFRYHIEAQDIVNSGWNYTSTSSYITLSFWIKSSVAQSFQGVLTSEDGTRQIYPFATGSLSADTWTKITKTISGNSNLTFNNDNNLGLEISIYGFLGTDFTASGVTENAWNAWSSSTYTEDQTSTWYTTNDATLELTGMQLEVGSVATDFEHRSFGQELALCQRYFEKSYDVGTTAGTATSSGCNNNGGLTGVNNAGHATRASIRYKVTKRAHPTVTTFDLSGNSGKCNFPDTSSNVTMTVLQQGANGCGVETSAVTSTDTRCYWHFTAEAEL